MTIEPTNVSEGLEPCPKCRSASVVFDQFAASGNRWVVECFDCDFMCETCETRTEAREAWNARATLSPPLPSTGVERLIPWLEAIREVLREAHFALDDSEDRTDDDPPVHHIPHENVMALDAALKTCEAFATDDDDPWYGPGPLVTRIIEQLLATRSPPGVERLRAEVLEEAAGIADDAAHENATGDGEIWIASRIAAAIRAAKIDAALSALPLDGGLK